MRLLRLLGEIVAGAMYRKEQELQLRHRLEMEKIIAAISTRFMSADPMQIDQVIDGEAEVTLELPTTRRGWLETGRLRLSTLWPLGLARAWSWLRPDERVLVYPTPDANAPPLPEALGDGDSPRTRAHGEQPHHLRDYRAGDMPRQIAWKASARFDKLLVREYESAVARDIVVDWAATAGLAYEQRISRLARWVPSRVKARIFGGPRAA